MRRSHFHQSLHSMSRGMSSSRRTHHHNSYNPRFNSSGHYGRRGYMGGSGYYGRRRYGPWGYYGYGGSGAVILGFIFFIFILFLANPLLGLIAIIGTIVYVSRKDKRKPRGNSPLYQQSQQRYIPQNQQKDTSRPKQVATKPVTTPAGYQQRPMAKACSACGAGLLPESKFCSECGTTV